MNRCKQQDKGARVSLNDSSYVFLTIPKLNETTNLKQSIHEHKEVQNLNFLRDRKRRLFNRSVIGLESPLPLLGSLVHRSGGKGGCRMSQIFRLRITFSILSLPLS